MTCYTGNLPEIGEKIPTAQLTLSRGDAWESLITLTQTTVTGEPINLTGATMAAYVSKELGEDALFQPTVVTVDPINGKFTVAITAEQSATLTPGVYANDSAGQYWLLVRMTTTDGQPTTLFRAIISCVAGVSL